VQGTIIKMGEKVGWIKPDEPVPELPANKDRIFLHVTDVDGEAPLLGAQVLFFAYKDKHGFGAENCQVMVQGDGTAPEVDEAKEKRSKRQRTRVREVNDKVVKLGRMKLRSRGKGQSKGERKEKKDKGPSGPDLPRERITEEMVTGEVTYWRRVFGWIKPVDTIDHPEAEKHGGKIYVHKKDLVDAEEVKKGDTVQFHVFADASGLGAEEAVVL